MLRSIYLLSAFTLLSAQAFGDAEQCKTNFSKEGSFLSGTTFKTWAEVEGVEPADAFKKVYLHTVKDGWKITSSDKEMGIISAAQDVSYGNGKTAPLNIIVEKSSSNGSKISITYSLSGGVKSQEKAVIDSFCNTVDAAKQ
jgi:hypothetical protein